MPCRANWLWIAVVGLLGTLSLLGACGQKGPLYLPEPSAVPDSDVPRPPAPVPAPAAAP